MSDAKTANARDILNYLAQYLATPPTLADEEYHHLTLTSDGKLRTDDPTTQAKVDDIEDKLDHATHGLEALRVLLAAIPTTPELEADAATRYTALAAYVDEVESLLKNATYGLSALKAWMDARPTERGTDDALLAASYVTERGTDDAELEADAATRYGVIGGYVDGIESLLGNVTYGLAALKDLIDVAQADLDNPAQYKADVSALALEATLTAIKGGGWTDETLVALMTAIEAIAGGATAQQVWEYATRGLTDLRSKLPEGSISVGTSVADGSGWIIGAYVSHTPDDVGTGEKFTYRRMTLSVDGGVAQQILEVKGHTDNTSNYDGFGGGGAGLGLALRYTTAFAAASTTYEEGTGSYKIIYIPDP